MALPGSDRDLSFSHSEGTEQSSCGLADIERFSRKYPPPVVSAATREADANICNKDFGCNMIEVLVWRNIDGEMPTPGFDLMRQN